jgi:hypothetical protein
MIVMFAIPCPCAMIRGQSIGRQNGGRSLCRELRELPFGVALPFSAL